MKHIQKIIVPWDFSNHAKAAFQYACRRFRGEAIKVVCVLEPPNPYAPGFDWDSAEEEKRAQQCEADFRKQAAALEPESSIEFHVAFGEPAELICQFAEQVGPNFIVMSTHGRTGIQKIMMGSISQKIVGMSAFPIILLPSQWFNKKSIPPVMPAELVDTN